MDQFEMEMERFINWFGQTEANNMNEHSEAIDLTMSEHSEVIDLTMSEHSEAIDEETSTDINAPDDTMDNAVWTTQVRYIETIDITGDEPVIIIEILD